MSTLLEPARCVNTTGAGSASQHHWSQLGVSTPLEPARRVNATGASSARQHHWSRLGASNN